MRRLFFHPIACRLALAAPIVIGLSCLPVWGSVSPLLKLCIGLPAGVGIYVVADKIVSFLDELARMRHIAELLREDAK